MPLGFPPLIQEYRIGSGGWRNTRSSGPIRACRAAMGLVQAALFTSRNPIRENPNDLKAVNIVIFAAFFNLKITSKYILRVKYA